MRKGQYKYRTAESLLEASVSTSRGCQEWTRYRDRDGYGRIRFRGKSSCAVTRALWELTHGPIPDGMVVMHACDNPPCINPEHLLLGTPQDNVADKIKKGRAVHPRKRRPESYIQARGSKNGNSKLSEADVIAIRSDKSIARELAARHNISMSLVGQIKRREAWSWLPDISK